MKIPKFDPKNTRCLCPFYRNREPLSIRCEGPFDEAELQLTFKKQQDRDIQLSTFCSDRFHNCEIYRCVQYNKYFRDP